MMGCDIHVGCEVRREGRWTNSGEVFDSVRDWAYWPLSRIDELDDERLLYATFFSVTDRKYGSDVETGGLRPFLHADIVQLYKGYAARVAVLGEELKAHRDAIPAHEWDYNKLVKPFELKQRSKLAAEFKLSPTQRSVIVAVVKERWKHQDEPLHLHLRDGDPPFKTAHPFDCRCYDLFAALADVRNGTGFAGCRTGVPIMPIAYPRGVPDDADPATLRLLSDQHTPSWLLLSEILAYNWEQKKHHEGYVDAAHYEAMRRADDRDPFGERTRAMAKEMRVEVSVCGDVSDGTVRKVKPSEYKGIEKDVYIHVKWTTTLRQAVPDEFFASLEVMKALGAPDDVRIVFDFDS